MGVPDVSNACAHGYDETTVAQDGRGSWRITYDVLPYFPTKESVVLDDPIPTTQSSPRPSARNPQACGPRCSRTLADLGAGTADVDEDGVPDIYQGDR